MTALNVINILQGRVVTQTMLGVLTTPWATKKVPLLFLR